MLMLHLAQSTAVLKPKPKCAASMAAAFLPSHFYKMKFALPINKVAWCQVQSGHVEREV